MTLFYLTLGNAIALSGVAAYFSIVGLIAIFAAAPIPIAIMGTALEAAKLVAASWVYRNWSTSPRIIKYYFSIAVVILSLITSMGIFGYLSKAHMDQLVISGESTTKLAIYEEKIKTAKENIETARRQLKQMDEAVDQVLSRSTTEQGAARANEIRRSQQRDRTALSKEIETNQKLIGTLNEEAAPIKAEVRKIEAEVGPIKYIAALMYGDNPDQNLLEKAVRWIIIVIVLVFDPMAILLLIAANISLLQSQKNQPTVNKETGEIQSFGNMFMDEPEDDDIPLKKEEKEKREWSKEMYNRVNAPDPNSVRIERNRITSIPQEILDRVFKK